MEIGNFLDFSSHLSMRVPSLSIRSDSKINLALSLLNDASMARWALFSYDGRAIRKIELPVLHG